MSVTTEPVPRQPLLVLPGFMPDAVGFAVRTTLALLLAYGVAFWMQLESASSAGVCVAIVAQPSPGMAMSKALYRIIGTLLGGLVAIVMVGAFGQDRTMLLVMFTLWLGACTFVAALLRDFRSYGAVLCGYTVGIIAVASIDSPEGALEATLNRVAAILLGVVAVAVVNSLLARRVAFEGLVAGLHASLADMQKLAADNWRGVLPDEDASIHLGSTLLAWATQATYAAAELPDGRLRSAGARSTIAALLGMLSASRAVARIMALGETPTTARPATPRAACLMERALDLRQQEQLARQGLETLEDGKRLTRTVRLRVHRDYEGAARNAIRTIIATGLGCVFCVFAGWSGATLLLIQQAAFTALLGMTVNPTAGAAAFAVALPVSAAAAGLVGFVLLPTVSGFVPFSLAVGAATMLAALATRHPATARYGAGLLLYFVLLLSPSNQQSYDLGAFLNVCMEQAIAVLFMVVAFELILPVSPRRRLLRVAEAIWSDLRRTLQQGGVDDQPARQTLQYDRLAQAEMWIGRRTPARTAVLHRLYAFAELDSALRRAWSGLHDAAVAAPALAPLIEAARNSLRVRQPVAIILAAQALLDQQDAFSDPTPVLRAVSGLYGAEYLLRRQLRALRRYGVLED